MLSEKKLKSISVFVPEEIVCSSLEKSGFVLQETATISQVMVNSGKKHFT